MVSSVVKWCLSDGWVENRSFGVGYELFFFRLFSVGQKEWYATYVRTYPSA